MDTLTLDGTGGSKGIVLEGFDYNKEVPHVGQELDLFLVEPNLEWKKMQRHKSKRENTCSN